MACTLYDAFKPVGWNTHHGMYPLVDGPNSHILWHHLTPKQIDDIVPGCRDMVSLRSHLYHNGYKYYVADLIVSWDGIESHISEAYFIIDDIEQVLTIAKCITGSWIYNSNFNLLF